MTTQPESPIAQAVKGGKLQPNEIELCIAMMIYLAKIKSQK